MSQFTWAGFGRLTNGLGALADPDAEPLMIRWRAIIEEDNKRGVLAGTDKDGRPMPPITYRPASAKPKSWSYKQEQSHLAKHGHLGALGDNLTPAEYRKLGGPPLAPRGVRSRSVANLLTAHGRDPGSGHTWFAEGAWFDVVSPKGVQFLPAHFDGARCGRNHAIKLPVRDLRGVRPGVATRRSRRFGPGAYRS